MRSSFVYKVIGVKPACVARQLLSRPGKGLDPNEGSCLEHDSEGQRFTSQPLGILRLSISLLAANSVADQWMYAPRVTEVVLATFLLSFTSRLF